jgi:UDP-2,3-diacylglucosamine pyrophosphatase LpxH
VLVFISDLHFVDGSAGEHNIPTAAVNYFFDHLVAIAHKDTQRNRIEEINIVLLGDIFDLLRTEYWLDRDENETPWGNSEEAIEPHALTIFDAIHNHRSENMDNPQTFELLGDRLHDLKTSCNLTKDPEFIYLPGNHDRLCNKYSSLRQLNSGTWRDRYFQSKVDGSFIAWKNMTYVIFYTKEERTTDFPVFETWTGALKTG